MILHSSLSQFPFQRNKKLYKLISDGDIEFAGNRNLKIYGRLSCQSGMKMKIANRVFFSSGQEAGMMAYRPCAHCMKKEYRIWLEAMQKG